MAGYEPEQGYPAITGIGMYIPEHGLTNRQLIDLLGIDSSPRWIEDHTGITHRYWGGKDCHPSEMAVAASTAALGMASLYPDEISTLLVSAGTQDHPTPNVASLVHGRLGLPRECLAVDAKAACAGFVINLAAASDRVQVHPEYPNALVVGTEICSSRVNPKDRRTAILFGDGAGAVTVQPVAGAERPVSVMLTEPDLEAIHVPAGGSRQTLKDPEDPSGKLVMDGPAVKRHALSIMTGATRRVAHRAGLAESDQPGAPIDWSDTILVPHQANARLVEAVGEVLGVPQDRCVVSVGQYGNTSSASIPMAIAQAYESGMIRGGRLQRVIVTAIGAGMVGGAMLINVALPEKS